MVRVTTSVTITVSYTRKQHKALDLQRPATGRGLHSH
jgi:hypothetical protein